LFAVAGCTVNYTDPPQTAYDEPPLPQPDFEFYELNQYGEWVDVYPHGLVWSPYVTPDWRPYVYGHWVWSEWEWMWISYEPFGWAVYHYGYWDFSPVWGWLWIPGYDWEPVRVRWMYYGDYVCWAPEPPPGYDLPDPWSMHTTDVWVVVHARNFTHYDLHRFRVKPAQYKDRYYRGATVHHESPRLPAIERHTRKTVPHVELRVKNYYSGTRTYKKVVLPESEKKIVKKYKPRVKKQDANRERTDPAATREKGDRSTRKYKSSTKQKDQTEDEKEGSNRSKSKSKPKKDDG